MKTSGTKKLGKGKDSSGPHRNNQDFEETRHLAASIPLMKGNGTVGRSNSSLNSGINSGDISNEERERIEYETTDSYVLTDQLNTSILNSSFGSEAKFDSGRKDSNCDCDKTTEPKPTTSKTVNNSPNFNPHDESHTPQPQLISNVFKQRQMDSSNLISPIPLGLLRANRGTNLNNIDLNSFISPQIEEDLPPKINVSTKKQKEYQYQSQH